jgi:hypothetical protein
MSLYVIRWQGGKNEGRECQGYFATNNEQRKQREVSVIPHHLVPWTDDIMSLQGHKRDRSYEAGFLHRTHPRITSPHAVLLTSEWQNGFSRKVKLRNGSPPVLYCGSTGNVRSFPSRSLALSYGAVCSQLELERAYFGSLVQSWI